MSASSDRRPLIVLAVLAVVAVVLFAFGAFGAAGSDPEPAWPDWSGGLSLGDPLAADDLRVVGGGCSASGTAITFTGACALLVEPVEGGWPWSKVTRRAKLVAGASPVAVTVTVQERALSTRLDPGESVRVTFTRDGGPLALACLGLGECTALLTEDTVP